MVSDNHMKRGRTPRSAAGTLLVFLILIGSSGALVLMVEGAEALTPDIEGSADFMQMQNIVDNETFVEDIGNISMNQCAEDSDCDGITDYDELNGYKRDNITYYTDPYQKSTDFDPHNDYQEITGIEMHPTVLSPGRHPLVPSYPDLKVDIGKITVNTLTKITSSQTKENYSTWDINTETVDATKENWGANAEAKVGFSGWIPSPYGEVKVSAYYDYLHLLSTTTISTTSGWNKDEWSMATAVDADKAARLKFYLKIKNNGTDIAKNVRLKFNIKIGENIVTTIEKSVANRIDPNTAFPADTFFIIEEDDLGNDITVTLDELKSIELGTPISVEILEINAKVPWEDEQDKDWSDYKADIDRTSAKLVLDTGSGVKEYRVFSGIRYPSSGKPYYYFMNITLENAINFTLGGEQKEDGVYIGGENIEGWRFGFDNSTFSEVVKYLNKSNGSLLSIPIRQGWTVVMKPPDKEPPKIFWATYTKDLKGIVASVWDNEKVVNVTAYVKIGSTYRNIILKDDNNDLIYEATFPEKVTDINNGYIEADDGKYSSKFIISFIPNIIVDDDLGDDPANYTWNTIQEGIDNANESDIIYVRNGTYEENIAIYKPLTLIGEDKNNTIIDGKNKGDAIYIQVNNVIISGLKINNGRSKYSLFETEIRGEVANSSLIWTPNNFGGFWYDVDSDAGNETLKAIVSGRYIYENHLSYTAPSIEVKFKYLPFGKYQVIGFMTDKYFAGYTSNTNPPNPTASLGEISTLANNNLHKVLIDDDTKRTISVGGTIALKEGYVLKATDIDLRGRTMLLSLLKDGSEVDTTPLSAGQTYVYSKKVGSTDNLPLIMVRFDSVFIDQGMQVVFMMKGMFQISEFPTPIRVGDQFGNMEVRSVAVNGITMINNRSIVLNKNTESTIMGNIKLKVADNDALRFYPYINYEYVGIEDPYSLELRGRITRGSLVQNWNAYSFSGFYYDLDQDIKPEQLSISGISGRTIEKGNLTYQTNEAPKFFEVYKNKGILVGGKTSYFVSGWGGEKHDALNGKVNKLSKVLLELEAEDIKTLAVGEKWELPDGYSLFAETINASARPQWARLVLSKDGNILENKTVLRGEVYQYSANLANETNIPIFITYVDTVFKDATELMQFKYTWLISQDVNEIKMGDEFGKMKVMSSTQDMVILKNNYNFSLKQGSIINVIGDIYFKVADSAELRYYPALIKTIPTQASGIKLDISENSIISEVNVLNSTIGINLLSSKNNTLSGNILNSNNEYGFILGSSSGDNMLWGNEVSNNGHGILIAGNNNVIYDNVFNNTNNFEIYNSNKWNITKQSGTNIIVGSYLGGNFWANPDGTGFSQTCKDVNGDGICDKSYTLDENNIDYLPLSMNFMNDKIPPKRISKMKNVSYTSSYINWTWKDPKDIDFKKVMVFIDDNFKKNVSKGKRFYNATDFEPNTRHTISTWTVDMNGNINKTWTNRSAWTAN